MRTPLRRSCPRCGIERQIHEGREVGLCRDCKSVEPEWPAVELQESA